MPKKIETESEGKSASEAIKPDIYRYHDYRQFLNDWIKYRKNTEAHFSLRFLARKSNVAVGYLSMILSGERKMLHETLEKIAKPLKLSVSEKSYLELLRTVAESESTLTKHEALEKLRRFRNYREVNTKEIEVYRYLTHWYYVAIREMVNLPDFKADAGWIQSKLRNKVSLKEIKEALDFLLDNGYLEKSPDGRIRAVEKELLCLSGVYRLALTQFHREMLELASASLDNSSVEERDITGYTLAIPKEKLEELKQICFAFLRQLSNLENKSLPADSVYHVAVAAFPLTRNEKEKK